MITRKIPFEYKVTQRSVNNKRLANDIHNAVLDCFTEFNEWEVSTTPAEFIVYFMTDYLVNLSATSPALVQWDVICDTRNNKFKDMRNGDFNLVIQYKQKNCINVTRLEYTIHTTTPRFS